MNLSRNSNYEFVKKFKLIVLKDKVKILQSEKVEFQKESLNDENSRKPYDD